MMAGQGAARVGSGTIHGILHQMLLHRNGQQRATREWEPALPVRLSEEGARPRVAGGMGSGGDGSGEKGGGPGRGAGGGVDVREHDAASEAEWGKGYTRGRGRLWVGKDPILNWAMQGWAEMGV